MVRTFVSECGHKIVVPENDRREWRSFKNSARTDGLELSHWVKANTDPDAGTFIMLLPVLLSRH